MKVIKKKKEEKIVLVTKTGKILEFTKPRILYGIKVGNKKIDVMSCSNLKLNGISSAGVILHPNQIFIKRKAKLSKSYILLHEISHDIFWQLQHDKNLNKITKAKIKYLNDDEEFIDLFANMLSKIFGKNLINSVKKF